MTCGHAIDALGADTGVLIVAGDVTFNGFIVTNVSEIMGTGISVVYAANVQLTNNDIELNLINGTGIAATNASGVVIDGNIVNVTADDWADGIDVIDSENAQITNNDVDVNVEVTGVHAASLSTLDLASRHIIPEKELGTQQVGPLAWYGIGAVGMYVESSNNTVVTGNAVTATARNLNETDVNDTYGAYALGIELYACKML